MVAAVDGYLTANAPWKQLEGTSDEQQQALRADVLYTAAEAIRIITALVYPVIPDAAARVWTQLGLGDIRKADLKNLHWRGLQPGTKLGELSPLFPRADKETITRMNELEQKNTPPPAGAADPVPKPPAPAAKPEPHISKLHSLVDGLAVAIAESTTETAAVVGIENAIAETVRETIGSRKEKEAFPRVRPSHLRVPRPAVRKKLRSFRVRRRFPPLPPLAQSSLPPPRPPLLPATKSPLTTSPKSSSASPRSKSPNAFPKPTSCCVSRSTSAMKRARSWPESPRLTHRSPSSAAKSSSSPISPPGSCADTNRTA